MSELKHCSKCGEVKKKTSFYNKSGRVCKQCYIKQNVERKRKKIAERKQMDRIPGMDGLKRCRSCGMWKDEKKKWNCRECWDCMLERGRTYKRKHKNEMDEYRRANKEKYNAASKKWRENNPEKMKAAKKSWNERNRDHNKKVKNDWYYKNREQFLEKQKKYHAKKRHKYLSWKKKWHQNLSAGYVKALIIDHAKRKGAYLSNEDITDEMINLKRDQIMLFRAINQAKEELNGCNPARVQGSQGHDERPSGRED